MVYSLDTCLEDWTSQHREEVEATNNLTLDKILRDIYEIQLIPLMPNKWIYHKESPVSEVLNYIFRDYEALNKEDEMEEQDEFK